MNETTIWAMQGAINHWWDSWHRFVELDEDGNVPTDEIPFWVSNLCATIQEQTRKTFDYLTGKWSDE